MSNRTNSETSRERTLIYHIRVRGNLDSTWSRYFDGMTVTPLEDGNTLLTGPVIDQAALHGLLKQIRDLGLPLLSVHIEETDEPHHENQER
jgi:hypothetical protein